MTMRRFTIRSLLLLVALSCVALAFWMTYIEPYRRDARIAAELTPGAASVSFRPDGPAWLRRVLGDDYCCRIFTVDLDGRLATDEDLRRLAAATRLERLAINGEKANITDSGLSHLRGMRNLNDLSIDGATDSVLRRVSELHQLERLILVGDFTDQGVRRLGRLERLRLLGLMSSGITDDGLAGLGSLKELRELRLLGAITDEGMPHLKPLRNLESLLCKWNPATERTELSLSEDTRMEFISTPLVDVASFMSDLHGIDVRVDEQSLREDHRDPATPVTMNVKGIKFREALNRLFLVLGLDWTIESDGVTITTEKAAARTRTGIIDLRRSLPNLRKVDVWWWPGSASAAPPRRLRPLRGSAHSGGQIR